MLLAFAGATLPAGLERHTPRTIVEPGSLRRELERTRLRGYAQIRDELEIGLSAVAAPVFDRTGVCIAALAVSGPTFRLARTLATLGGDCATAADAITASLDETAATDHPRRLTSTSSGAHA